MKRTLLFVFSILLVALTACNKQTDSSANIPNLQKSDVSIIKSDGKSEVNKPVSKQSSGNYGQNPVKTDSAQSSDSQIPSQTELSFSEKTDAFLDGATVNDSAFISYYKSLGEYDSGAPVVKNAIFAAPDASSDGDGTLSSPYTLQDALDKVKAGQTLYLRGGTFNTDSADGYFLGCKGTKDAYITVRNYPNESVKITNPFSSATEAYAFQFDQGACYFVMEGLEIDGVNAFSAHAIAVWGNGQNHFILRNLKIHNVKTTAENPAAETDSSANAILLCGENRNAVSNVIIAENRCYDNVTGWAESISVAGNCEYVYVFENTVHDMTNIGIDFYGNAGYCPSPELDQPRYSVASANEIYNGSCSYADCAGLYVDGARDVILQYNLVYNCQYGIEIGSEEANDDYPVRNVLVRNNVLKNNSVCGIRVGGYEKQTTGIVRSAKFVNNTLIENGGSDGGEIIIAKSDGLAFINNLVYASGKAPIVKTDFEKTYSANLSFTNNLFVAHSGTMKFGMFLNEQNGLTEFDHIVNGSSLTANVTMNGFTPTGNVSVANVTDQMGNYDFNLSPRIKGGKAEVGAIEI